MHDADRGAPVDVGAATSRRLPVDVSAATSRRLPVDVRLAWVRTVPTGAVGPPGGDIGRAGAVHYADCTY